MDRSIPPMSFLSLPNSTPLNTEPAAPIIPNPMERQSEECRLLSGYWRQQTTRILPFCHTEQLHHQPMATVQPNY